MNIAGKVMYRKFTKSDAWMTESGEIEQGVCSARTVVPDKCEDVPVRIINVMDRTIHLEAGTVVSELRAVEIVKNDEKNQNTGIEHLTKMLEKVDDSVPQSSKDKLRQLVHGYSHIFSKGEYDLGQAKYVQHHINTGNAKPFRQTLRRHPDKYLEVIDNQVETMRQQGLIENSRSDWASNIVLARKKDGSLRLCIDYRQLNLSSEKNTYPLPLITSCLDALGGSKWFSTFDLRSGYHQVELAPEDMDKTTFLTRRGAFKFRVMPFGLSAAPATFQRLMDVTMTGLNFAVCLIYLDDIIVFSKDLDEHLARLEMVFKRLETVNLKLKPSKCCLLCREVTFLEHLVSDQGISADPDKCKAIKNWPIPNLVKDVFLGLCSYYRRFVQGFAAKAAPMFELLRKNHKLS